MVILYDYLIYSYQNLNSKLIYESYKVFKNSDINLALTSLSSISFAETITVNSNSDDGCDLVNGICASCDSDAANPGDQCTLRAAIYYANVNSEDDVIEFDNNYVINVVNGTTESIGGTPTVINGSLPFVKTPMEINGGTNTIEIVGNLASGGRGFSIVNNFAAGASLKNLTVHSFETLVQIDNVDGQTNGACVNEDKITVDNLNIGTDTTGNTPQSNQTTGLYITDSKCVDVLNSTMATSGSSFGDYNVRVVSSDDLLFDNSNIGVTSNRNSTMSHWQNFSIAFAENVTIKNSYLSTNNAGGTILNTQDVSDFHLAKSYLGFDSMGAKLGSFDKALVMDAGVTGITSLSDLETQNYSSITGCTESKSNICENHFWRIRYGRYRVSGFW